MMQNVLLSILIIFNGLNYYLGSINNLKIKASKHAEISKFDQSKLVPKNILNGALKILIPEDFVLMDAEMLNHKYPKDANRPILVYTDENGEINIAFNYTLQKVETNDISKIKESISNQMKQAAGIELIDSESKNINNKEFFIIKFYSQAIDTEVYNLMFGTELDGRLLIGTFNCTISNFDEWQPIADEIVNSIEVL